MVTKSRVESLYKKIDNELRDRAASSGNQGIHLSNADACDLRDVLAAQLKKKVQNDRNSDLLGSAR